MYRLLSLGHLVSSLLLDVFKSCPTLLSFLSIWYVLTEIIRKNYAKKERTNQSINFIVQIDEKDHIFDLR